MVKKVGEKETPLGKKVNLLAKKKYIVRPRRRHVGRATQRRHLQGIRHHVQERWAGHDASGDTWELLDNLTNCEEAITAFELATCRSLPCRAAPPAAAAAAPPPIPPAGFTVDLAPPGDLSTVLVGRTILYRWPVDGRQRGTVISLFPRRGARASPSAS